MSARKLCLGLWLLFAAVMLCYALSGRFSPHVERTAEKLASAADSVEGGNFTLAPESARACGPMGARYLETAERCRAELAQFWFGETFPLWFKPCSITVKQGPHLGAGGITTFQFDRGDVFGWTMRVQGSPERILDSVLPHEVNHTIFASKFRRPLPRWVDEGAATLFEHPYEQRRQLLMAKQVLATNQPTIFRDLDRMDYPSDMQGVLNLYATGYTLVSWLVARSGREQFVEFVADRDPPSISLPRHYGLGLADLEDAWRLWLRDVPEGAECPLHASLETTAAHKPAAGNRPKLWIFLSKSCIPCGAFRLDWKLVPGFRRKVEQYFDYEIIEGGVDDPKARELGVDKTPTFVPGNGGGIRIEGYCGAAWLLDHLKPYMREPLPPGAEGIAGENAPPSPFKRSEPAELPTAAPPVPEAGNGESGNPGRVLPGIVGTAAGTAAGTWFTGLVGLAIGGPIGAAIGLAAGALVKRLVTRGTSAVVTRAEGAIEQRVDHARERWFPPAQGAPPPVPPAPPVSQPMGGMDPGGQVAATSDPLASVRTVERQRNHYVDVPIVNNEAEALKEAMRLEAEFTKHEKPDVAAHLKRVQEMADMILSGKRITKPGWKI